MTYDAKINRHVMAEIYYLRHTTDTGDKMRKKILVALIISTISMVSYAQTNPLSDLVGALGKLGNTPKQPPQQQQEIADDRTDTNEIVRQLASQNVLRNYGCDFAYIEKQINVTADKFRTGQYITASSESLIHAQQIADCATRQSTASLSHKNIIGELLAMSAIGARKAGHNTTEIIIRGEYALTLLKLNLERNKDLIAQVESEVLPKSAPKSSSTATTRMSAFDMATKYQKNKLAFVREYEGKTVQVNGVISSIGGDAKQGLIVLKGIPKHPDEQAFRDVVQCRITDSEALDNAMRVEKGQKISLRGIYMNKQLDMGPTLYDCKVVS